jgi:hypothetical protein
MELPIWRPATVLQARPAQVAEVKKMPLQPRARTIPLAAADWGCGRRGEAVRFCCGRGNMTTAPVSPRAAVPLNVMGCPAARSARGLLSPCAATSRCRHGAGRHDDCADSSGLPGPEPC